MDDLLDTRALASLRDLGDDAFLIEVIDLYLVESKDLVERVGEAISAGDVARVVMGAHSLKGTSATVGAALVATLAHDLERAARGGSLEGGAGLFENLKHQYVRTHEALVAERARVTGRGPIT